ncbi:MAG: nitroreductase family protein [Thermoplasmatales archaeon]|nr:MAG: nitroreductase family protein [Thermoplasmatales archaeon]
MNKKILGIFVCVLFIITAVLPVTGELNKLKPKDIIQDYYSLPPPISVDMVLEVSICRRMSVRSFTEEEITDEELSTILWAAYGYTENGSRPIFSPNGEYSTVIYVIRSEATYKYVPENHSLSLFKSGNYLHLGQYDSPIKFGLVWDMSVTDDEMRGMAEVGMIGQGIYFDANALGLGTVTTGMYVEDLYELGIPAHEKPAIIMPLGHPSSPYDFTYDPLPESNLPMVMNNTMSLEDAINNRIYVNIWDDTPLSLVEQSQLIWSSYGYSYLIDNVNSKRHRTLPSGIGVYPYKIYAANHSGVYQYSHSDHSITEIVQGDKREDINNSIGANNITITTASWIIIPFLDTDIGDPQYQGFWYYEVGAITHNVLLEATVLNLSANVIYDISDEDGLRSALGISSQTNLLPLAVVPAGTPILSNPPEIPGLSGPSSGIAGKEYTFTASTTDPDGDQVFYLFDWGDETNSGWLGPFSSGAPVDASHTWTKVGEHQIKVQAKDINHAYSNWSEPLIIQMFRELFEVKSIQGGFFKIKSTIKNNDFFDASDVQWNIVLDGGFILTGRKTTDVITSIPGGDETEIKSNPIIGLGPITVRVTAEVPESSTTRQRDGFVFLFYIKVNPGG